MVTKKNKSNNVLFFVILGIIILIIIGIVVWSFIRFEIIETSLQKILDVDNIYGKYIPYHYHDARAHGNGSVSEIQWDNIISPDDDLSDWDKHVLNLKKK